MLVIATNKGYYKRIREKGEQFEYPIDKGEKLPSWMAAAEAPADESETEEVEETEGTGLVDPLA